MASSLSGQETEMSIALEAGSVTVRQSTANSKLHFCIRETDKCIQIGECCTYVEISVNGSYLESMITQGNLSASGEIVSTTGENIPVFQIHWSDIADVGQIKNYMSKLKVELKTEKKKIKKEVMKEIHLEMRNDNMKKIRKIVNRIFRTVNGRLVKIATGCLEFTIVNDCEESARKLKNQDTLKDFESFFTTVLIPEKILETESDVCLTISLLDTKEISRSEVMKYRFAPVIPSNLQSTKKEEEIVALVEDRLKNATAQITQKVEERLSDHRKEIEQNLEGVRSELHQLIPRFNEMLLQNLLPRIQESIIAPQSRELSHHIPSLTESQEEFPDTQSGEKIEHQPEMESLWAETAPQLRMESLATETAPQPKMESLATETAPQPKMESLATETAPRREMESLAAETVPQPEMESLGRPKQHEMKTSLLEPSASSGYGSGQSEDISIDELAALSRRRPFHIKTPSAVSKEKTADVKTPETTYPLSEKKGMQFPDVKVKETTGEFINKFMEFMIGDIEKEGYEILKSPVIETSAIDSKKTKEMDKRSTPRLMQYLGKSQMQYTLSAIQKAKSEMKKSELHKSADALDTIVVLAPVYHIEVRRRKDLFGGLYIYGKDKMACVSCARPAGIIHPFPCHWKDVFDHLDKPTFDTKGDMESVFTGLLVALCVIAETGKILDVGRYHRVLPRIIIFGGLDFASEIVEFIEELTYFNINPPFIFLKYDQPQLTDFVMSQHQKTEILIGKALTYIKEPLNSESNHNTILDDFLSTISDYVVSTYIKSRIVDILDIPPPLGTRVRWAAWKTYEGERIGTVVNHVDPRLVHVIFDDGKEQYFEWRFVQNHLTFSLPLKPKSKGQLPVGTLVQRGKDWNFGDQDGGENEIGVVINRGQVKDGDLERQVCWRSQFAKNKINMYRFGDQGQFDIEELNDIPERLPPVIPDQFAQWEQVDEDKILPVKTCAILESISREDSTRNEVKEVIISLKQREMMITKSEKDFKMVDMTDDTMYTLRKTDRKYSRMDYLKEKLYKNYIHWSWW